MKFKSNLSEGIFLKRQFRFLVEMALSDKRKRMLFCPNLNPLPHSEVLGSNIWFSHTPRLSQGYLDVLELIEVNGGEKVVVNPEYACLMLRESISQGKIPELKDFRFLYQHSVPATNHLELLLKENGEQCFLHIEPLFDVDNHGIASVDVNGSLKSSLQELLLQKRRGNQAILVFCAMHTGAQCLKTKATGFESNGLNANKAQSAQDFFLEAKNTGLEVMAFGIKVTLKEAILGERIPILQSENIITP